MAVAFSLALPEDDTDRKDTMATPAAGTS
eukprot:SAG22_NODE_14077_length_385_cov_0.895105_1_plen_28_part_10